jgi:ferredoxin
MKIAAYRDRCCGSGNCAFVAPDMFALDDATGQVLLKVDEVAEDRIEAARQAADECPVAAIEVG